MKFADYWKAIVESIREEKRKALMTVKCGNCGERFDCENQSGICPHVPIKQFIYGEDVKSVAKELTKGLREDKIDPTSPELSDLAVAIVQAKDRHRRIKYIISKFN